MEDLTPPSVGERIVRPSIYQAKETFEFAVRVFGFGSTPAFRERCRATMRRNIKAIVARLRERKRLYTELGLFDLDRAINQTCIAMCEVEDTIDALEPSPNVIAAGGQISHKVPVTVRPWRLPSLHYAVCFPAYPD
jgi:hypothetical protein